MTQYSSNSRNRATGVSKMFAGLVLAATSLATLSPVWGQYTGGSRWSSANPPTPAAVDQANIKVDDQLRRLPPIEEEVTPSSFSAPVANDTAQHPSGSTKPSEEVAANPQKSSVDPYTAAPVDWANPSVVIGPEGRMVSHEEVVGAPQGHASRYSKDLAAEPQLPASHAGSRFTESAGMAPVTPQVEAATASGKSVYARVFDENDDNVEQPALPESVDQTPAANMPETQEPVDETLEGDEPATSKADLSPIFACRLLGLPATQAEEPTQR
ncbi:hypothetical protein DTL42_01060 [Bremerella cremea]|uniref:Uncharacterized protein n=1 Tax=Bremerella cremea TaxID=1031537 RepID=A0A368KYX8_9BACT|nr:hypothetical protein [Bremerella cremea]RCS56007.1 hypothetical protein DTL42_01060 [Bremerella cremea]